MFLQKLIRNHTLGEPWVLGCELLLHSFKGVPDTPTKGASWAFFCKSEHLVAIQMDMLELEPHDSSVKAPETRACITALFLYFPKLGRFVQMPCP